MNATCDVCGRFIADKDFETERAKVRLVSVDSDYSTEEYEMICPKCINNEKSFKNDKPV